MVEPDAAKGIQFGHLGFDILSDDDFDAIRQAVMLPVDLHYNEFEYVVTGGDYDDGKFRRKKLEDGSSVPVKTDLDELKKHIVSCKGVGKRGLPILKIVAEIPRKNARK